MTRVKIWQVDAFTDRPFAGNPAAVCWLENDAPELWMQSVAAEMNLAETAFVIRRGKDYGLRWFTPEVEVALCGHATLASAHALYSAEIHPAGEPIRFQTKSGVLTCHQRGALIEMDFPSTPAVDALAPPGLLEALGVSATYVGKTPFDYLIVVETESIVRSLTPDFRQLKAIATRGVIVTSRSDDRRYDFVSRFFAPAVGVDEDPVTGSAHCGLGPYWSGRLGKSALTAYQASRRGGVVHVQIAGERIFLGGHATTVLNGELVG